ncbi:hypothetical protein [Pseudomonas nicosulfuronedens]
MELLPPDSTPRITVRRPMPIAIKLILLAGSALAIYLFAMTFAPSSRGYGGPGGWGSGILYFMGSIMVGGTVIWSLITWLAYRSMQAKGRSRPIGEALLIFFLPVIMLVATMIFGFLAQIMRGD